MQREIETFALDVLAHPQADNHVDDFQDDQGHDHVVDEHGGDADELGEHLAGITLDQPGGAAVGRHREHAGEDGASRAADRMDAERVERIVIAEEVLEPGAAPVADDAGRDADGERTHRTDETRRRRDGDEPRDRAGADADDCRLAADDPLDDHPGEAGGRGGEMGDGIAMPACMPALTAEPALKPNQPTHSSEAPIMVSTMLCGWRSVLALAEHDSGHQPGGAGIHVHHGAAGEVEDVEFGVADWRC